MNKKTWSFYAPIYERAMRSDKKAYSWMYQRISVVVEGKEVLECATGPGLLAKHIASSAKSVIATDYAAGMIKEAEKGDYATNLRFEVADATSLPYENASFDVVILANALHVMPEPEQALREVRRVLKPDGILICPNFVSHGSTLVSRIWSGILRMAGIQFEHQWNELSYHDFLKQNQWDVIYSKLLPARITLSYVEASAGKTHI